MNKQDLLLDIHVTYDITAAYLKDAIDETISYVDLAKLATHLATKHNYMLLERFAVDFLNHVEEKYSKLGVQSAYIKIKKTQAVSSTKYVFVELERKFV